MVMRGARRQQRRRRRSPWAARLLAPLLSVALVGSGCSLGDDGDPPGAEPPTTAAPTDAALSDAQRALAGLAAARLGGGAAGGWLSDGEVECVAGALGRAVPDGCIAELGLDGESLAEGDDADGSVLGGRVALSGIEELAAVEGAFGCSDWAAVIAGRLAAAGLDASLADCVAGHAPRSAQVSVSAQALLSESTVGLGVTGSEPTALLAECADMRAAIAESLESDLLVSPDAAQCVAAGLPEESVAELTRMAAGHTSAGWDAAAFTEVLLGCLSDEDPGVLAILSGIAVAEEPSPGDVAVAAEDVVGPTGGSLEGGGVEVNVPAGAFDADVTVTVGAPLGPFGLEVGGPPVHVDVEGELAEPLTVR